MLIYVVNLTELNERTLKSAMNSVPITGHGYWQCSNHKFRSWRRNPVGITQRPGRISCLRECDLCHDYERRRSARPRASACGANRLQAFLGRLPSRKRPSFITGLFLQRPRSKPGNLPSRTAQRQWQNFKAFCSLWSSKARPWSWFRSGDSFVSVLMRIP
jgi:hypothetical protein